MDGLDVCRQIRADARARILMLDGARRRQEASSWIWRGRLSRKPVEPRELLARLRSTSGARKMTTDPRCCIWAPGIDAAAREVRLT